MFHEVLKNKKGRNCSAAFPSCGLPPSGLYVEKCEQFTPFGREPVVTCSHVNVLAVFTGREQGLKVQVVLKSLA